MSLSSNSRTMKVKVILVNDIRVWRYESSQSKLATLREFVCKTFELNDFWLQFEDDEGDRLTLSSQIDFEDAFICAINEGRKSLKIYVIQGSISNAQKLKTDNEHNEQKQDELNKTSSSTPPPCEPDPACEVNQCFEMRSAAIDFLQNEEISKLLPEVFRRMLTEIKKSKQASNGKNDDEMNDDNDDNKRSWDDPKSIENIIIMILNDDMFLPITKHELFGAKICHLLPCISGRISAHLGLLMNLNSDVVASWIPHLTSMLIPALSSFDNVDIGMEVNPTTACHAFFPTWCAFMKLNGCSDDENMSNQEAIHLNVQCDACKVCPIKGVRYKCIICSDYDLCSQCESFGKHDNTHPMIKFHRSQHCANPPFHGLHEIMRSFGHGPHQWFGHHWKKRFSRCHNKKNKQFQQNQNQNNEQQQQQYQVPPSPQHAWWTHHQQQQQQDMSPPHHGGHHGRRWHRWNRWQQQQNAWQQPQQPHNNNNNNDNSWRAQWQQWCENRQQWQQPASVQPQLQQQNSDIIGSVISSNEQQKIMADFVRDVTLPDRTYYPTDTVLTKTWKMKNNGDFEWGPNVELVFFKGNESLTLEKRYPVNNAKPGQEVEVSAVVKTPKKAGRYCSYYRLQRNGEYFGPRVWVDIFAVDEEISNDNKENKKKLKIKQNKKEKEINKLQMKEAKISNKQLKLESKQSKLINKLQNVSKKLVSQKENENPKKLIKKQEKLQKQIYKNQEKLSNTEQQRLNTMSKINENNNGNDEINDDEHLMIEQIANAAIKDIEIEEENKNNDEIVAVNDNGNNNDNISCVCGALLLRTTPIEAYNFNASNVRCDICGKFCSQNNFIYHCMDKNSKEHPEGYDLCSSCVEYQRQSFIMKQQKQQQQKVNDNDNNIKQEKDKEVVDNNDDNNPSMVIEEDDDFIYSSELDAIRAMGFDDDEKIKAELIQQKGNIQRVANRLLMQ